MKKIVYTQRVEIIESYQERRDSADQRIADFIYSCGYLPIPLPNDAQIVKKLIDEISPDGIVLTGGNSLVKYGGNAPERDMVDSELIRIAIEKRLPVYGFCRGMQSILCYFGNELENVSGHVAVRHMVSCSTSNEKYEVNSYHNQACKILKDDCGLQIVGQASDGVIEEICHKDYPIYATMWHPEREMEYATKDVEHMKKVFG